METNTNTAQLIQQTEALHRLIEEKLQVQGLSVDQRLTTEDDDAQVQLSNLLLQLEALQGSSTSNDVMVLETDSLAPDYMDATPDVNDELISTRSELNNDVADEIIKELKKVRRQNAVTHCLLSALIVLTLVWQLSEMRLISNVQKGLKNPVKALGGLLLGKMVRPGNGHKRVEKAEESHSLPKINMELPNVDIQNFSGEE